MVVENRLALLGKRHTILGAVLKWSGRNGGKMLTLPKNVGQPSLAAFYAFTLDGESAGSSGNWQVLVLREKGLPTLICVCEYIEPEKILRELLRSLLGKSTSVLCVGDSPVSKTEFVECIARYGIWIGHDIANRDALLASCGRLRAEAHRLEALAKELEDKASHWHQRID